MGLLEMVEKLPYNHPYRWDGRLFGKPKLWTPAEISTTIWCDAYDEDTITESSGAVSQWDDKSGNDNHLTQATGAEQPTTGTRNINGLNALDFDGVADNFDIPGSIDMIGKEMWLVLQIDTTPPYRDVLYGGGGNTQAASINDTSQMRIWAATNPYSADTKGSVLSEDTAYVLGFLAHSDTKKFVKDGTLTTTTDTWVSPRTLIPVQFGRGQYNLLNGIVGETVVTASALSTADRQKLEGYLAWKWGLISSLPGDHPYKNLPPTA